MLWHTDSQTGISCRRSDEGWVSYVMVDIEADGPIPGDDSMVCLGARRSSTFARPNTPTIRSTMREATPKPLST